MATVHWPSAPLPRRFAHIGHIPYLLDGEELYPDGINAFIYERARGSLPSKINQPPQIRLKPLGRSGRRKLAYNLCDALTWMESISAHPTLGSISWRDIQPWHLTELYMDALLLGFWSENYWATRVPTPLAPATAKERVGEMLRCLSWTSACGYRSRFDYEPEIQCIQLAKDDALLAYRQDLIQIPVETVPTRVRPVRKQPGHLPLPTLEHLHDFYSALPRGAKRLAARQMFETGMRLEEVVENTLISGRMHTREHGQNAFCIHPAWPTTPYLLEYDLSDDKMLGVIPTAEVAWFPEARRGYQCKYRIVGKGPKIRAVTLPPEFVQSLWAFIDGSRVGTSAHVYVNRDGNKLTPHEVWQACRDVNLRLKAPLDITPHVLRHAHACYFLETSIIDQAKRQGYDPAVLPSSLVRSFGETVLLVIQQQLGHSVFSSTKIYLEQLVSGNLGLVYHRAWNAFLDETRIMPDHG